MWQELWNKSTNYSFVGYLGKYANVLNAAEEKCPTTTSVVPAKAFRGWLTELEIKGLLSREERGFISLIHTSRVPK
jgi:hypothetical protein